MSDASTFPLCPTCGGPSECRFSDSHGATYYMGCAREHQGVWAQSDEEARRGWALVTRPAAEDAAQMRLRWLLGRLPPWAEAHSGGYAYSWFAAFQRLTELAAAIDRREAKS